MLAANNITYRVGKKELVSDVSLTFESGKLHLIIGPNGAGKSTLIKLLARFLRPQSGTVNYDNIDVTAASEADLARRRSVLSQAVEVAFPLTVREVVMMGRYPHFGGSPGPADESIVDDLMEQFEVDQFGTRNYQTLSGGERQRVNFARVLAQLWTNCPSSTPCRYLFLDEPLTFLDIHHQIAFMKKIREFAAASDMVSVGVVHDLNLAARFADQIIILNEGRVVAAGTASDVLTVELIREVFSVEATFVPEAQIGAHLVFD